MAGITAQQIMRRKYNITVRHTVSGGGFLTEVSYDGKIVAELPDDCLASGSLYQTQKIWRSLPKVLFEHPMQPAYAYLPGKNVKDAVASWDRETFETELLPKLKTIPELSRHLEVYDRVVGSGDDSGIYELYDVLVRIFSFVREKDVKIERDGIHGLVVTDPVSALTNRCGTECVRLCKDLKQALCLIYNEHTIIDHEGEEYLVSTKPVSPFKSVHGTGHQEMSGDAVNQLITAGDKMEAVKVSVERGGVDTETKHVYMNLVASILRQGGLGVTSAEKDLVQFRDTVVADGLVGKTATVGLGKIFGEGPLAERLDIGFRYVCQKVRHMDAADCYKLAASRLSGMNSAKTCANEKGVLMLRDRTASTGNVARPSIGLSH